MKKINKILFTFLFFFCVSLNVSADTAEGFGYASPTLGGGSGNCLSLWGGCWAGPNIKAFRLTLVDFTGRKIEKTKSVDFSSIKTFDCADGKNCDFRHYSLINSDFDGTNAKYGYKYSKMYDDYNIASKDEFLMYYDSKNAFLDQYTVEKLIKTGDGLLSDGWEYEVNIHGRKVKYSDLSFYDMFLHYCGFLHDNEKTYKKIPADDERYSIIYNSTVIVEPAYLVYFYSNGTTLYRYGTVTELAQYMLDHPGYGLDYGVSRVLRNNVSLCVSSNDKDNKLQGFTTMETGIDKCSNNDYYFGVSLEDLVDEKKAYGISVGVIKGINDNTINNPDPEPTIAPPTPGPTNYTLNICDKEIINTNYGFPDRSEKTGFKIIFSSDGSVTPSSLKSDDFEVSGSDENQKLYCYDSVEYHLDDMMSDLGGTYNKFVFINPRPGEVTVDRYCLLGEKYSLNEQYKIDDYKNSAVKINFYGKTYNIYPSDSESNDQFDIIGNDVKPKNFTDSNIVFNKIGNSRDVTLDDNKYKYVSYSFKLKYIIPQNLFFIGNGILKEEEGYIDGNIYNASIGLSNLRGSFGYSNKMINEEFFTGGLQVEEALNSTVCPITYKIDNSPKININFRTISLRNPFPARDGTSRLPAENWLSTTENDVYSYITNNRGVMMIYGNDDPELMYSVREPMYTVTLTPSIMLNIRKYNKMYSYYSMYKLEDGFVPSGNISPNDKNADKLICNSYGRECYSQFLRDDKYLPQQDESSSAIGGVCFFGRNTNDDETIRNQFNKIYEPTGINRDYDMEDYENYLISLTDPERKEYAENYGADVNFNGRLDSEDLEIIGLYAKSNSEYQSIYGKYKPNAYYTCAHKTFKSGGPIEEVEE